jgi:hypothetical protein
MPGVERPAALGRVPRRIQVRCGDSTEPRLTLLQRYLFVNKIVRVSKWEWRDMAGRPSHRLTVYVTAPAFAAPKPTGKTTCSAVGAFTLSG